MIMWLSRIIGGFLAAVTASSLCLEVWFLSRVILGRFQDGTLFPLKETVFVLGSDLIVLPVIRIPVFVFSLVPCVLLIAVLRLRGWKHYLAWVLCGAVVAILVSILAGVISHHTGGDTDTPEDVARPLIEWIARAIIVFVPAGSVGGIMFRPIAGKS